MKARVVSQLFYEMLYSMGDAYSAISDKSSGLSGGAQAGIAIAVLVFLGLCGGAVACWFHRKKQGDHLFDHQQFDNPVYFSSTKQVLHSDNGVISSDGTAQGT